MAKWIIDRTINLDYTKTKRVLELLLEEPRKDDSVLERQLMSEGVLKNGSDGALRRRWYTYLRNYGLLRENDVTEMGEKYANGVFSLNELAMLQMVKRKIKSIAGNPISPLKIVSSILVKLYDEKGSDEAYLSQAEFSNYCVDAVDDTDESINDIFDKIVESRESDAQIDIIPGEHTDIWFNNFKQTDLFEVEGKSIFVEEQNIGLIRKIYNVYKDEYTGNIELFADKFINSIEVVETLDNCCSETIDKNISQMIYQYLFLGSSLKKLSEISPKYNSKSKCEDLFNKLSIRLDEFNRGIYKNYIGYENVIAEFLESKGSDSLKSIAEAIKLYTSQNRNVFEEKEEGEISSIEEIVIAKYNEMDLAEMESEIDSLYIEFQDKFAPVVLNSIPEKDLPKYMFYSEKYNRDNMCWNLEFHPKIKGYFGACGGGTAYLYGLHFSQKHKKWMTGTSMKQIPLDEQGAIERAVEIRKILTDAVEVVEKYKNIESIDDYQTMHNELLEICGDLSDKLWFRKYLHMMYPSVLSTYYNWEWLTYLNRKCGFEQHADILELSGELSLLSKRVNLPNAVLSKVLFELFGYPNSEQVEENEVKEEESKVMITRSQRTNKIHPLNRIVYGAPGTGKTYSMKEYAVATIEGREVRREQLTIDQRKELNEKYKKLVSCGQVVFTTFHQSYGYEDFIQGLRPDTSNGAMEFVPVDGVFKKIADKAMQDTENNYVIIIDEINRGNISKVFGELITLIEDDKRWGESEQLSVILPSGEEFAVPNNLYIIGTMNSADKSIALIDTALRRRFDFIEVSPNSELVQDDTLRKVLEQLNAVLRKELDSSDLLIGHAYFIGKSAEELVGIMNRNIIPLLYEYFYDNEKKVKDALVKALDGTEVKPKDNNQGRIRVE